MLRNHRLTERSVSVKPLKSCVESAVGDRYPPAARGFQSEGETTRHNAGDRVPTGDLYRGHLATARGVVAIRAVVRKR